LQVLEVQRPGGKRLPAGELLRSLAPLNGEVLGPSR
jgi:hypothetical protein